MKRVLLLIQEKNYYGIVYNRNIALAKSILIECIDEKIAWKKFYDVYEDPDGYRIKEKNGVTCTADALFSAWRIYNHEGFNGSFIEAYEKYREEPIFFFPREQGGINQRRFTIFGDRIDHFLFDLKQYSLGEKSKLESVYQKEETKKWLESFSQVNQRPDFGELVKWFKIDGIFVNENLEVFDLETTSGSIIEGYSPVYPKEWSTDYYTNLKKKMDIYIENNKGAS